MKAKQEKADQKRRDRSQTFMKLNNTVSKYLMEQSRKSLALTAMDMNELKGIPVPPKIGNKFKS